MWALERGSTVLMMGGRGYGCGTDAETDNENETDRTDNERQLASAMFSVRRNRTSNE